MSFLQSKIDQVLFSSATSCGYESESDCTYKRTNCGRRKGGPKGQKDEPDSGLRFKFMLEGIRQELYQLQRENADLRNIVVDNVEPEAAEHILRDCEAPPVDIFLPTSLMEDDEEKEVQDDEIHANRSSLIPQKSKTSHDKIKNESKSNSPQNESHCRSFELNFEQDKEEFLAEAFQRGYAY